ncbi:hypothetical protein SARC_16735, partial [Sphaeroforma arctica JP610]
MFGTKRLTRHWTQLRTYFEPVCPEVAQRITMVFRTAYENWLFLRSSFRQTSMNERRSVLHHITQTVSGKTWRGQVSSAFTMLERAYAAMNLDVVYDMKDLLRSAWVGVAPATQLARNNLIIQ